MIELDKIDDLNDHDGSEKVTKPLLLEGRGLTKRFGSFIANDQVDITLAAGEVHAILGENGAGKSTLMKTLYGVHEHEEGDVFIDGKKVTLHPPARARALGISMVFQDFRIIPSLTVLENIALAYSKQRFSLGKKALRKKIIETSKRYQLAVNPDAYVWELDLGQRQRIEILKVLIEDSTRLVIFDEPTSVLTPHEVDAFLEMIRRLREDNYGILLITHKIKEVIAVADKVSVLREGKLVFTSTKQIGFSEESLVAQMIGKKEIPKPSDRKVFEQEQAEALKVRNLAIKDDRGFEILKDVTFTVKAGEILGVAGISGNGQRELIEALYGIRALHRGEIIVCGHNLTGKPPASYIESKIALVSEDPLTEQIIPGLTILEHMVLSGIPMYKKGLGVDWKKVHSHFTELEVVHDLGVASSERIASKLSGGNVQRMVLSRALAAEPKVLLVSYPSRGLDIATVKTIQSMLIEKRDQGAAIILVSEDLTEILELSDRVVVLGQSKIHGPFDPKLTDSYEIGRVMLEGDVS